MKFREDLLIRANFFEKGRLSVRYFMTIQNDALCYIECHKKQSKNVFPL